jgi:hypothetical protein
MKTGLIYQPCGLGDILFLQKIAHHIKNKGYDVYWPVICEFEWLNEYIDDFTFITDPEDKFIPHQGLILSDKINFPKKEYYSNKIQTEITEDLFFFQGFISCDPIMSGKYDSINIDWRDWRSYIKFNRNIEKENILYYDILGLKDDEEYVFVNRNFCTRPNPSIYRQISIDENDYGCKVIEMNLIPGYSMFDWCKVLENCKEINMVATSFNFLLESPALFDRIKTKKLTLHHRCSNHYNSGNYWNDVKYLFELPWNYC